MISDYHVTQFKLTHRCCLMLIINIIVICLDLLYSTYHMISLIVRKSVYVWTTWNSGDIVLFCRCYCRGRRFKQSCRITDPLMILFRREQASNVPSNLWWWCVRHTNAYSMRPTKILKFFRANKQNNLLLNFTSVLFFKAI